MGQRPSFHNLTRAPIALEVKDVLPLSRGFAPFRAAFLNPAPLVSPHGQD